MSHFTAENIFSAMINKKLNQQKHPLRFLFQKIPVFFLAQKKRYSDPWFGKTLEKEELLSITHWPKNLDGIITVHMSSPGKQAKTQSWKKLGAMKINE